MNTIRLKDFARSYIQEHSVRATCADVVDYFGELGINLGPFDARGIQELIGQAEIDVTFADDDPTELDNKTFVTVLHMVADKLHEFVNDVELMNMLSPKPAPVTVETWRLVADDPITAAGIYYNRWVDATREVEQLKRGVAE